ncbi:uncharacterized protein METZ01_LOCUS338437, partial [marine metagenome]
MSKFRVIAIASLCLSAAIDVTDKRQIYKQSSAWTQDGLELRIDARPEPAR